MGKESRRFKILEVPSEILLNAAKKGIKSYTITENPLPSDATIVYVKFIEELNIIQFVIESREFPECSGLWSDIPRYPDIKYQLT